MKRFLFLLTTMLCLGSSALRAQLLAVKTDALMDVLMVPNLNGELVVGERSSINASVFGSYKVYGKDIKMIGLMPEYRFWFNGRPMTREFVGLAVIGVNYDLTWGKQVYDGNAIGAGLTFGYSFNLSSHWNLECYGSVGAIYYDQRHYYTGDRDEYLGVRNNSCGYAVIPFKLGVSFSYIIK
ncbi:MAG: DUF3575 domain-containing protein [Clostridium sp.]|nr:DUF3575 domain-containing protein [Clostridium sp.]